MLDAISQPWVDTQQYRHLPISGARMQTCDGWHTNACIPNLHLCACRGDEANPVYKWHNDFVAVRQAGRTNLQSQLYDRAQVGRPGLHVRRRDAGIAIGIGPRPHCMHVANGGSLLTKTPSAA